MQIEKETKLGQLLDHMAFCVDYELAFPVVVEGIEIDANQAEIEISKLTEDEIDIFCDGEETEMEEIANRNETLLSVHKLMNEVFNSW